MIFDRAPQQLCSQIKINVAENNLGPHFGQSRRTREADILRATGDQRHFAIETIFSAYMTSPSHTMRRRPDLILVGPPDKCGCTTSERRHKAAEIFLPCIDPLEDRIFRVVKRF